MSANLQKFHAELTREYTASGLPPSVAAVLAYLTICEPARQPAGDIQSALSLSAGSVSMALNLLVGTKLVVRSKQPGDKRYYYELQADAWERTLTQRMRTLQAVVDTADKGLQLMPHNKRLAEMRRFYAYFANEFGDLMERYRSYPRR